MNTGKVLIGVLVGMAAGAALGMLFAPDSGENTRKGITQKGKDYLDELDHRYEGLLETLSGIFSETKDDASAMMNKAESKAHEYRRNIQNKIQEVANQDS